MELIDKAVLLNRIATEVHYDSEHSLEMYAKMLSLINDAPDGVVRCKDCTRYVPFKDVDGVCLAHNKGVLIIMSQNGYCNLGERKEDAETD